ncbi:MAG TPA: tetratricopeptide repeat protein [Terriglobia bacterium]|jgi:tetratricopeptide (TPR) repeat protein|nr:tetratricopeptide repeat protein [Terriglobia bacterium]
MSTFVRAAVKRVRAGLTGRAALAAVLSLLAFGPRASCAQTSGTAPPPEPPVELENHRYIPPGAAKSVEIGNFYLKRGNYKAAASRFEEAVGARSDYAPAYLGLGKTYEKMGLRQKALNAYQQFLDLLPSDKDAEAAKDVHRAMDRLREGH